MTTRPDAETIKAVKNKLFTLPGVQAVAESVADNLFCLKVYFDSTDSLDAAELDSLIEGVSIVTTTSGTIQTQRD